MMKKTERLKQIWGLVFCSILILFASCSTGLDDAGAAFDKEADFAVADTRESFAQDAAPEAAMAAPELKGSKRMALGRNNAAMDSMAYGGGQYNGNTSNLTGIVKKIDGRKIIYTVDLSMNVPDIAEAVEKTRKLLDKQGGYVVSMRNSHLEVRVPVDHFDAFCKELQGVGMITNHHMYSSDITQQMTDTQSRIAALELLQKRLHAIAQQAKTVKEMLDVERELNRVIRELENLKKDMKNYTLQTDYCIVRINFIAQIQQPAPLKQIPVAWMNQYGSNLLSNGWLRAGGDENKPYKIDLPGNFMITGSRLKNSSCFLSAVSPQGSVIRLSSHANMKGGTLDYYSELAERYFTHYQNFKIKSFGVEQIGEKRQAIVMNAERKQGDQTLYYYWVCFTDMGEWMVADEGKVYCFEYQTDDEKDYDKMLPEIKNCLQTLNLSIWR